MPILKITLMPRSDAPAVAPASLIALIKSYRGAICVSWQMRTISNMTKAGLCERTGMRASHLSDYLNDQEFDRRGRELRDMPAKYLPAFEQAVGNSFASQWLASQSQLTILEAQIAEQRAPQDRSISVQFRRRHEIDVTPRLSLLGAARKFIARKFKVLA
ncbi:Hypothetical protein HEAR2299 [Herminiimonas arsenicoxydans]|uniref:Uncharacterized protein n=1 Tax=Herminiimonas arsenicoxydans TaxID=204773 RepID=A4G7E3_HERAR|nr:Hypothetical protein HEAR2299 [Herminiimonas arsenicoxydans]